MFWEKNKRPVDEGNKRKANNKELRERLCCGLSGQEMGGSCKENGAVCVVFFPLIYFFHLCRPLVLYSFKYFGKYFLIFGNGFTKMPILCRYL